MHESNSIGKLVVNLVKTDIGEHVLYRDYGLVEIDAPTQLTRTQMQAEVEKWYPSATVTDCELIEASESGHFDYNIHVEER